MKQYITLAIYLLLAIFLSSCTYEVAQQNTSVQPETLSPNKALKDYYLAMSNGDIDKVLEISITDKSLEIINFKGTKEVAINFLKPLFQDYFTPKRKEFFKNLSEEIDNLQYLSVNQHSLKSEKSSLNFLSEHIVVANMFGDGSVYYPYVLPNTSEMTKINSVFKGNASTADILLVLNVEGEWVPPLALFTLYYQYK